MAHYATEGTRYSPQIPLSGIGEITDSKVYWEYTLNGGSISIETRAYNGILETWSEWSEIENVNDPVPNLSEETDILECRQILSTPDDTQSPVLERLDIIINNQFFNNLLESDGSDIVITKSDGITVQPQEFVYCDPLFLRGELYFKSGDLSNTESDENYYYIYFSGTTPSSSENIWTNDEILVQHLSETSSLSAFDSSPIENHGLINGDVILNWDRRISEEDPMYYPEGKAGRTFDFKGGNVDIFANNTDTLAPDYLTCSAIISVDNINDYDTIIGKGWVGAGYSLRLFADGSIIFSIHDEDTTVDWTEAISPAGTIQTNNYNSGGNYYEDEYWYKIRATYDGDQLEIMVNGDVVATQDASIITRAKKDQNLGIGAEPGDDYGRTIDGRIQEVKIFDKYISKEWEITEYRNQFDTNNFYTIQDLEYFS